MSDPSSQNPVLIDSEPDDMEEIIIEETHAQPSPVVETYNYDTSSMSPPVSVSESSVTSPAVSENKSEVTAAYEYENASPNDQADQSRTSDPAIPTATSPSSARTSPLPPIKQLSDVTNCFATILHHPITRLFQTSSIAPDGHTHLKELHRASVGGQQLYEVTRSVMTRLSGTQLSPLLIEDGWMLAASTLTDEALLRLIHICTLHLPQSSLLMMYGLTAARRCQRYQLLQSIFPTITPQIFTQLHRIPHEHRSSTIMILKTLMIGSQQLPTLFFSLLPPMQQLMMRIQRELKGSVLRSNKSVVEGDLSELRLITYTCLYMYSGWSYMRDSGYAMLEGQAASSDPSVVQARPSKSTMDALIHIHKPWLETHPPSLAQSSTLQLATSTDDPATLASHPDFGMPSGSSSWFEGVWLCSAAGGTINWSLKYHVSGRRMHGVYKRFTRPAISQQMMQPRYLPTPSPHHHDRLSYHLSPTIVTPRHVTNLFIGQQLMLRWQKSEYYPARISARRLNSYAIQFGEPFGTRWLEPQHFEQYFTAMGNPAQINFALAPELVNVPSDKLVGQRVLVERQVNYGMSMLGSLSNSFASVKAYFTGIIVHPHQRLYGSTQPLAPLPASPLFIKFDLDSKTFPMPRDKVILHIPIQLNNMYKVNNYYLHRPVGSLTPQAIQIQQLNEDQLSSNPQDEHKSYEDEEGDPNDLAHMRTYENLQSGIQATPSVNSRDSNSAFNFGYLDGVFHRDLSRRLLYQGTWKRVDQEHPGNIQLTFHDPPTQSIQSRFLPSSFTGLFVHSEQEYGEWIGIRNKYVERFSFSQPPSAVTSPTTPVPASPSTSISPYTSTPSSLIYFDGSNTSVRIPGDYALHFSGFQPYTISVRIYIPDRPPMKDSGSVFNPIRQCIYAKSSTDAVSGKTASSTGAPPIHRHNYMLELNVIDNSLTWTHGFHTLRSASGSVFMSGDAVNAPPSKIPFNKWTQVTCSFDGRFLALFIDGILSISQELYSIGGYSTDNNVTPAPLMVGGLGGHHGHFVSNCFQGFLTDLTIWNYAQTKEEIVSYVDETTNVIVGHEPGLLGYWPLHSLLGPFVLDMSGNGLHGSVTYPPISNESRYQQLPKERLQYESVHQHLWAGQENVPKLSELSGPWMSVPSTKLDYHLSQQFHTDVNDEYLLCGQARLCPPATDTTVASSICEIGATGGGIWSRSKVSVEQGFVSEVELSYEYQPNVPPSQMSSIQCAMQLYAGSLLELVPLSGINLAGGLHPAHSLTFTIQLLPPVELATASHLQFQELRFNIHAANQFGQLCLVTKSKHFIPFVPGPPSTTSSKATHTEANSSIQTTLATYALSIRYLGSAHNHSLIFSCNRVELFAGQLNVMLDGVGLGTNEIINFANLGGPIKQANLRLEREVPYIDVESENERKVFVGLIACLLEPPSDTPSTTDEKTDDRPTNTSRHLSLHSWNWLGESLATSRHIRTVGDTLLPHGWTSIPSEISTVAIERTGMAGLLNAILEVDKALKSTAYSFHWKAQRANWLQTVSVLFSQLNGTADAPPPIGIHAIKLKAMQFRQLRQIVMLFGKYLQSSETPANSTGAGPTTPGSPSEPIQDLREGWLQQVSSVTNLPDLIDSFMTLLSILPDSFYLPWYKPSVINREKAEYASHNPNSTTGPVQNYYMPDTATRLNNYLTSLKQMATLDYQQTLIRRLVLESLKEMGYDRNHPDSIPVTPDAIRRSQDHNLLWWYCSRILSVNSYQYQPSLRAAKENARLLALSKCLNESHDITSSQWRTKMQSPDLLSLLAAETVFVPSQRRVYSPEGVLMSVMEAPDGSFRSDTPPTKETKSTDLPIDITSASFDTTQGTIYFQDLGAFVGYFATGDYSSMTGKITGFIHNQQSITNLAESPKRNPSTVTKDPSAIRDVYELSYGQWFQTNYRFAYPCHFTFQDSLSKFVGQWNMDQLTGEWVGMQQTTGGGHYSAFTLGGDSHTITPGSSMSNVLNRHQRSYFGYSALLNLGSTCYQNSSLIALFMCHDLKTVLLALSLQYHSRRDQLVTRAQKAKKQEFDVDEKKARDEILTKMNNGTNDESEIGGGFMDGEAALPDWYDEETDTLHLSKSNSTAVNESLEHHRELNILAALQLVFGSLQYSQRSYLDLTFFKNTLKKPFFNSKLQQDSLQFVQYLLETLSTKVLLPQLPKPQSNSTTAASDTSLSLTGPSASSPSSIPNLTSSIFGGHICTSYVCSRCGHARQNTEEFTDLGVSFPKNWEPITDFAFVKSRTQSNIPPPNGYERINVNLNGSIKNGGFAFLCVKREADKPPITDIRFIHGTCEIDCASRAPRGWSRLETNLQDCSASRDHAYLALVFQREKNGSPITQIDLIQWFESDGRSVSVPDGFVKLDTNLQLGVNYTLGREAAVAPSARPIPPVKASATTSITQLPLPLPPATRALFPCIKKGAMIRDIVVVVAPSVAEARKRMPPAYTFIEVNFNVEQTKKSQPELKESESAPLDGCYFAYTSGGTKLPITGIDVRPVPPDSPISVPFSKFEQVSYYSLGRYSYALIVTRGSGCPLYSLDVFRAPVAARRYGGFESVNLHPSATDVESELIAQQRIDDLWRSKDWRNADGDTITFIPTPAPMPTIEPESVVAPPPSDSPVTDAPSSSASPASLPVSGVSASSDEFDCWVVQGNYTSKDKGTIKGVLYFQPDVDTISIQPTRISYSTVPEQVEGLPANEPNPPGSGVGSSSRVHGRWLLDCTWSQSDAAFPQLAQFAFDPFFERFEGYYSNGVKSGEWNGFKVEEDVLPPLVDPRMSVSSDDDLGDSDTDTDTDIDWDPSDEAKRAAWLSRKTQSYRRRNLTSLTFVKPAALNQKKVRRGPIVNIFGILKSQFKLLKSKADQRQFKIIKKTTGHVRYDANMKSTIALDPLYIVVERQILPDPATRDENGTYAGPSPIIDVQIVWGDLEPVTDGYQVAQMMDFPPDSINAAQVPTDSHRLNTNLDNKDGVLMLITYQRQTNPDLWSKQPLVYDLVLIRDHEAQPTGYSKITVAPSGLDADLNAQSTKGHSTFVGTLKLPYAPVNSKKGPAVAEAEKPISATPVLTNVASAERVPPSTPMEVFNNCYYESSCNNVTLKILYAGRGHRISARLNGSHSSLPIVAAGGLMEGIMVKPIVPAATQSTPSAAGASSSSSSSFPPYHLFGRFHPNLVMNPPVATAPGGVAAVAWLGERNKYPLPLEFDIDRDHTRVTGRFTYNKVNHFPPYNESNSSLAAIPFTFTRDHYALLSFLRNPRTVFNDGTLACSNASRTTSLQNMVDSYFSMELMTGLNQLRCHHSQCGGRLTDSTRTSYIHQTPPKHLILTAKRFAYDSVTHQSMKIIDQLAELTHTIQLPHRHTSNLDANNGPSSLPPSSSSDSLTSISYGLYAMIIHSGAKLDGGHYYVYCRSSEENLRYPDGIRSNKQWMCFNDHNITHCTWNQIVNKFKENLYDNPYMFFYRRLDSRRDPFIHHYEPEPLVNPSLDKNILVVRTDYQEHLPENGIVIPPESSNFVLDDDSSTAISSLSNQVCPGVADAIRTDNIQFFHEEIATPIGQTRAQLNPNQSASSDGNEATSTVPCQPATFFLHRIETEVRRRHKFSQPWPIEEEAVQVDEEEVVDEEKDVTEQESSSEHDEICPICLVPTTTSSHTEDGKCIHAELSLVECPHCFASMTAAQIQTHIQPHHILQQQLNDMADATKLKLPPPTTTGSNQLNPDRLTCMNEVYYQHFQRYQFPYPSQDSIPTTPGTMSRTPSQYASSSVVPHSSASALNELAAQSLFESNSSNGSLSRSQSKFNPASSSIAGMNLDQRFTAAAGATSSSATSSSMVGHHNSPVSNFAPGRPNTSLDGYDSDASGDLPPIAHLDEETHSILQAASLQDQSSSSSPPTTTAAATAAATTTTTVAGEEFPPACEMCQLRMVSFQHFLQHMGVCPMLL